jgi:chaperonin GroES
MENKSGINPVDVKVLILPDPVEEKTKGGIILTDSTKDKEQMAQVKGTIVACASDAFWEWGIKPVPGMHVYYGKYAGYTVKGADGQEYRLVNDNDIVATLNS